MAKKQTGNMPTTEMGMTGGPEMGMTGGMPTTKMGMTGEMPTTEKPVKKPEEFNLHKYAKKIAGEGVSEVGMKKGGKVKAYKSGGSVSSASKRADGCAIRGKTKA